MWVVALATYVLAIFHRSSLAVAGLAAADRFGITAAQLATFTMLQLVVYAGMQVPVGLLVDRWGPRAVMLTGITLMTVAQVGFALTESYVGALGARTLVGMGDAMTWISVLRLVSRWFPARQVPVLTQLSGTLGQSGAIAAAIPMGLALRELGWTGAYLVSASAGVVTALGLLLFVSDGPDVRRHRGERMSLTSVRASLSASWAHPGTRLGFWMHFVTCFSAHAMSLLWGYPFFVQGEGRSEATAGVLLSLMVVGFMWSGPVIGVLVSRFAWHRSTMVLGITATLAATWTVVLAWPGPAPLWLLVVLTQVVGVGGPASVIGFDLARTSNPAARLASATGVVNQAGFTAALVLVIAIGLVLDWRTPGSGTDYTPEAFRWAMSTQYVLWALGAVQVVRYRRRTRRVVTREELRWVRD
ncbi:MAG: MFS transporter [Nocardioides sp.]|nr:MFS transporter [Nocardioides sp.]